MTEPKRSMTDKEYADYRIKDLEAENIRLHNENAELCEHFHAHQLGYLKDIAKKRAYAKTKAHERIAELEAQLDDARKAAGHE